MNDFGRLLEKEIPRLRRYARALTRDRSRADDLVQDTLVRAIANQRRWQRGTDLRAWLFTIMHNQNVNNVRRSVREGIAVTVGEAYLMVRSDATGVLSLRDFDRVLARIPEEQRQVILLIGLEGASYEEAAAILDVPAGTVRSRLSRGRESLRNLMDRGTGTEAIRRTVPKRRRFVAEVDRTRDLLTRAGVVAGVEFLGRRMGLPAGRTSERPSLSGAAGPIRRHWAPAAAASLTLIATGLPWCHSPRLSSRSASSSNVASFDNMNESARSSNATVTRLRRPSL